MVERDDPGLCCITRLNHPVGQPGDELPVNPLRNPTAVRIRGIEVALGISEASDRAVPGAMIPEEAIPAGFHVIGNPLLQLLNSLLVQHHPALDRIDFADEKQAGGRVRRIEHLEAGGDIAVGGDAEVLAASGAELRMRMFKAAHP